MDEVVQYLVFRADLALPKGKLAAQAGHAVQLALRTVERVGDPRSREWLEQWEAGSFVKVAVKVGGADELGLLCAQLDQAGVLYSHVVDEGRSVVAPGTLTAVGVQPLPRSIASAFFGALKLL